MRHRDTETAPRGSCGVRSSGHGSGGVGCVANMHASCSSSASWKQISPYSGSRGNLLERRGDRRGRAIRADRARVAFATSPLEQIEDHELVGQRDRDIARDPRRAIALRVVEKVAKVDVGEPRARQEDAVCGKRRAAGEAGMSALKCARTGRVERGAGALDARRTRVRPPRAAAASLRCAVCGTAPMI